MEFDRITSHSEIQQGQPCIRGTRLTVRRVLDLVATYPDRQELSEEFPELEDEDIRQALAFAGTRLEDEVVELRPGSRHSLARPPAQVATRCLTDPAPTSTPSSPTSTAGR